MVAGGEARPVTLSDLDLDLRSQVFWPRHTMDIPGTPSQMWKLSQIRGSAAVILCRFGHDTRMVGRFGLNWCSSVLKNEKLTLSMSYVGVRFLVGSVESSGSAEEEGEG